MARIFETKSCHEGTVCKQTGIEWRTKSARGRFEAGLRPPLYFIEGRIFVCIRLYTANGGPQTFADVIGQQHITDTLRAQLQSGRLSHAYLFTGTRGTGKTTCAKILARAVNCEHPVNGDPCNECARAAAFWTAPVLDVTEIDAASNNGVDNIRDLAR